MFIKINKSIKKNRILELLNHQNQDLNSAAPLGTVFFLPASPFPEQRLVIKPNLKVVLFGVAFGVDGVGGCRNQVLYK